MALSSASQQQQQRWIYKIIPRDEWKEAEKKGKFEGSGVDLQDGFIHFSSADQAVETATKYFAGQTDLLLVAVDANQFTDNVLRWEVSRGGALFPHLYGPLDTKKVEWVKELPVGNDGKHEFPNML